MVAVLDSGSYELLTGIQCQLCGEFYHYDHRSAEGQRSGECDSGSCHISQYDICYPVYGDLCTVYGRICIS